VQRGNEVIDRDILRAAVYDSNTERGSTRLVRQFTFRVVDRALRRVYGDDYSTLCLQSSAAIQKVLEGLKIRSKLIQGHACLGKATVGEQFDIGWAGFWGEDHHVWVETQFDEYADLTISQLHLHPAKTTRDEPIPPIWWHSARMWPPTIKYLPLAGVTPDLEGKEREEFDELMRILPEVTEEVIQTCSESELRSAPILLGPAHMNRLVDQGHPWIKKTLLLHQQNIPLPAWVQNRMDEMKRAYFEEREE
jgi:hypothetical protein